MDPTLQQESRGLTSAGLPAEGHDEQQPLLGQEYSKKEGESSSTHLVWGKWRRGLVVCVLWLAQVLITSAYSLVGPFLPLEVHVYIDHYR